MASQASTTSRRGFLGLAAAALPALALMGAAQAASDPWTEFTRQTDATYPGLRIACLEAKAAGYHPDDVRGIYRRFVEPRETGLDMVDGARFKVAGVL